MWVQAAIVFMGGGLGAVMREFCMLLLPQQHGAFPLDIFVANVLASFLLGLVTGLHRNRRVSDEFVLLVGTGFTGGMSTFSSFIYGAFSEMAAPGQLGLAMLYIVASLVAGYSATLLGIRAAKRARAA